MNKEKLKTLWTDIKCEFYVWESVIYFILISVIMILFIGFIVTGAKRKERTDFPYLFDESGNRKYINSNYSGNDIKDQLEVYRFVVITNMLQDINNKLDKINCIEFQVPTNLSPKFESVSIPPVSFPTNSFPEFEVVPIPPVLITCNEIK